MSRSFAANPAHLGLALLHQILALELDAAAHDAAARGKQANDRVTGRRLAATGFSDEAEGFSGLDGEADASTAFTTRVPPNPT